MWHKAIWKGHPMRLELTRVSLLVELANHYTTRGAFHVCMCVILWIFSAVVYRFRRVSICISQWHINRCGYIYVWVYMYVNLYRGQDIVYRCVEYVCVYVVICILWRNHSSTSSNLNGDGQMEPSCDLKDFNFIITVFSVSWRHTIWQYFYD